MVIKQFKRPRRVRRYASGGAYGVDVKCLQEAMRIAYYDRDSKRGLYATFAWLVEEVGELAEALLSGDRRKIEEEAADVLAWLLSVANLVGINMEEAFKSKYRSDLESAGCLGGFEGPDNRG